MFINFINFFIPRFIKFYFQSNKKKISEIGLLFRNFPKYFSLTVGDQNNGFVCSKKDVLQNFPSGRFLCRYAASYLFLIKKVLAGSYATQINIKNKFKKCALLYTHFKPGKLKS